MENTTFKKKYTAIPLTELEQSAFCQTTQPKSETLEVEFTVGVRWQSLPITYMKLPPKEIEEQIRTKRAILGKEILILGHHYQRDEIIQFADITGDSFKLAQHAANNTDAKVIIFCGVHFMAETAAALAQSNQKVILPNMTAGCSMSDMAKPEDVLDCWNSLKEVLGPNSITPITYMNSAASIKALCGGNNGYVCTSSNAGKVMEKAFGQTDKVLFLPDQHLGRNTAKTLGIPLEKMIVWNPFKDFGGNSLEAIKESKVILWKGHCSVHTRFNIDQISNARSTYPDINILVHPECTMEVVDSADYVGSTEYIRKMVEDAPGGSIWGIGTEISMVNRLSKANPNKTVFCLDPIVCPCSTMYRIHPAYLLWVIDNLLEGIIVNAIDLESSIARNSKIALDRMLSIK